MPRKVTSAPLVSSSTRASIAATSRGWSVMTALLMRTTARDLRHKVFEQFVEHGEPILHPAGRAGQVDDHGVARGTGDAAAERGLRGSRQATCADGFGDSGQLAIHDGPGRFGGAVGGA